MSPSDARLIYIIGRVDQGIRQAMRVRLAEWTLSVPEFTVLAVLRRRPGLSNAQLARRALLKPQSMNEILVKLEERGLVNRDDDPADARVLRAALTPDGRALLDAAEEAVIDIEEQLFASVSDADREIVTETLGAAMARLRSDRVAANRGPAAGLGAWRAGGD